MFRGESIFIGLINEPKRFGFNSLASDFAGQIEGTKKPARFSPYGLSGLHLRLW